MNKQEQDIYDGSRCHVTTPLSSRTADVTMLCGGDSRCCGGRAVRSVPGIRSRWFFSLTRQSNLIYCYVQESCVLSPTARAAPFDAFLQSPQGAFWRPSHSRHSRLPFTWFHLAKALRTNWNSSVGSRSSYLLTWRVNYVLWLKSPEIACQPCWTATPITCTRTSAYA